VDIDGRITLKSILNKWGWKVWIGFKWLRRGRWWDIVNMVMNLSVTRERFSD
jgi:hypothetical protein